MNPPGDVVALSAFALSQAIYQRELSCGEVMHCYLDRIDEVNPVYNAIVALQPRDQLLAQAEQCDLELARGEYRGWMHGMPQAIKDLSPTKGIVTCLGSRSLAHDTPLIDGLIVERIKRAGAIIIGKTNTPEFGLGSQTYNAVYGVTRNAFDPSKCAGGSSGGAAVALATYILPVADGSDMGGSLRNPAAFNNVYGFRPSRGLVPQWPSQDQFYQQLGIEGPMARDVRDLTRLLATMAGYDQRVPLSLPGDGKAFETLARRDHWRGKKIGWLADWDRYLPVEPGILELCEQGLARLAELGCEVQPISIGFPPEQIWQSFLTLRQCIVSGKLIDFYRDPAKRSLMKPEAVWEVESGLQATALDIYQASVLRSQWYAHVCALFEQFDFLATPTAQVFPFDALTPWPKTVAGRSMDTYHRWMEIVVPWTMAGLPVLSLPVGFGTAGLPMGMQLIGAPRADALVLQLGDAYCRSAHTAQPGSRAKRTV
jgi:amidase